jgi:hypothetical protein
MATVVLSCVCLTATRGIFTLAKQLLLAIFNSKEGQYVCFHLLSDFFATKIIDQKCVHTLPSAGQNTQQLY